MECSFVDESLVALEGKLMIGYHRGTRVSGGRVGGGGGGVCMGCGDGFGCGG